MTKVQKKPDNLIEKAKEYAGLGLSVLPTNSDKSPAIKRWKFLQSKNLSEKQIQYNFSRNTVAGIGIICGEISGNLEVIDVDTKNDPTGKLDAVLLDLIKDVAPVLYSRLVIARTVNKGVHIYYRCDKIEGSQVLARAKKVLVETRGEGGYVIAPPSTGYVYAQGTPESISEITLDERDLLFSIARSFHQIKEKTNQNRKSLDFEDYNQDVDVIELLENHGWKVMQESGDDVRIQRPGKTGNSCSANWNTEMRLLYIFSTSTDFEENRAYTPTQIFTVLECGGDMSEALQKLEDMGYGGQVADEPAVPPFPLDGFPPMLKNFVKHCQDVFQTPLDFWGGAVLSAVALGIGDKMELKTRYKNTPLFWTCTIGHVSTGKTEPLKLLLEPFRDLDFDSYEKYKLKKEEFDMLSNLSKKDQQLFGAPPIKPEYFTYTKGLHARSSR